jgi:hypothetical protein
VIMKGGVQKINSNQAVRKWCQKFWHSCD